MNRRYKGAAPLTFLTLPEGEVFPGDVLTGASAEAVAGRTDFEDVAEPEAPAHALDAPASDAPNEVVGEGPAVKPRKSAAAKAADQA